MLKEKIKIMIREDDGEVIGVDEHGGTYIVSEVFKSFIEAYDIPGMTGKDISVEVAVDMKKEELIEAGGALYTTLVIMSDYIDRYGRMPTHGELFEILMDSIIPDKYLAGAIKQAFKEVTS